MNPVKKLHPLVATAAGAVIVLSAVGVAAFTGVLPGSKGATEPAAVPAAAPAPAPAPTVAAAEPHKAKPSHKVVRHVAARKRAEPAPRHVQLASVKPPCPDCGVIEAVRAVEIKGKGSGVGAAAGGLIGAVAGHEVGGGRGKTLATVLGAVGGAIAGNEIEKKQKTTTQWQVTVRLENGHEQVVTLAQQPPWREGDHVRLVNGTIEAAPRS
jgi:outer membrane lipoprotein SlyB